MYLILILVFFASLIGTYLVRFIALKNNIIDIPNERSSHSIPTPRGGGLAIVLAFYTGLVLLFLLGYVERNLTLALFSGVPIMIISIIDDIRDISPRLRLLTHLISGGLVLYFIGGVNSLDLGFYEIRNIYVLYPLTLIGILWFINLYNFLDGIDGYASVEAIFIAAGMYFFVGSPSLLVFLFSVFGFLIWNWPKAKIFMGDVGSTILGFSLIVYGIYYNNNSQFNFLYWLIFSSLFWFDATYTLYRRWKIGDSLSVAHKKHAYQRIIQGGSSVQRTLILSIIINVVFFTLVYLVHSYNLNVVIAFVLCIGLNIFLNSYIDNKKAFK